MHGIRGEENRRHLFDTLGFLRIKNLRQIPEKKGNDTQMAKYNTHTHKHI